MEQTSEKFDAWGIVEVVGYKRFAGRITEQTIAGSALVRVDVPAVVSPRGQPYNEFTKLIGVASIYCITPTTEELARKAARALCSEDAALPVYIPEERQIPASVGANHDDVDDNDWGSTDDPDSDRDHDAWPLP